MNNQDKYSGMRKQTQNEKRRYRRPNQNTLFLSLDSSEKTELKAAGASGRQDLYAGDDAWREWFDVCFVDGCANAAALREQVASAMYAQLARFGFTRADVEGADPVLHFDAYFMLTGSRSKPKPLKLYFQHRMAAEDRPLNEFVCGTLFGSGSGRIHDIVRDWLATAKGWPPRSIRDTDGKRHLLVPRWTAPSCGRSPTKCFPLWRKK